MENHILCSPLRAHRRISGFLVTHHHPISIFLFLERHPRTLRRRRRSRRETDDPALECVHAARELLHESMCCSASSIVSPESRTVPSCSTSVSTTRGANPSLGSSNKSTRGFATNARAIAKTCCSPPLSHAPFDPSPLPAAGTRRTPSPATTRVVFPIRSSGCLRAPSPRPSGPV
jgi:hypothetical protein